MTDDIIIIIIITSTSDLQPSTAIANNYLASRHRVKLI